MQLFSADAIVFSKKFQFFFWPEKMKKRASKVAHNRPTPFFPTVQPRPQPTARNWFSIWRNHGTRDLCSYLRYDSYLLVRLLRLYILRHFLCNLSSNLKIYWQNAKKNLIFHFAVGRHASFPQQPVVKMVLQDISSDLSQQWVNTDHCSDCTSWDFFDAIY